LETATITVPVPLHDQFRRGTSGSTVRQSELPRSLFETEKQRGALRHQAPTLCGQVESRPVDSARARNALQSGRPPERTDLDVRCHAAGQAVESSQAIYFQCVASITEHKGRYVWLRHG